MRRWLVVPSIAVHITLIIGLLFLGAWHLDKLEAGKVRVVIGYPDPPRTEAEAAGSPRKPTPFIPKTPPRVIPPVIVTPPDRSEPKDEIPTTPTTGTGNGLGSGEGSGSGSGSGSGTDPKGECTENCDPPAKKATPAIKEQNIVVPPKVLTGLFRDGDRQPQPADVTKTEMHRDGHDRSIASFEICLGASGNVTSSRQLRSSGYPAYDSVLTSAIAGWHYNPYTVDGHGIPVCSVVTFVYAMK
jgi:hypothetical protein